MNKKMLLLGLILSAATAYGAAVDINVTAKLVKPLGLKTSNGKIVGQALTTTTGEQTLTPVTVSFTGGENASIRFTVDQELTLAGQGATGGNLTFNTTVDGGSVTSTGTEINSDLVLSSSGDSALTLGGKVNLGGSEASQLYKGDLNISVDYN